MCSGSSTVLLRTTLFPHVAHVRRCAISAIWDVDPSLASAQTPAPRLCITDSEKNAGLEKVREAACRVHAASLSVVNATVVGAGQ